MEIVLSIVLGCFVVVAVVLLYIENRKKAKENKKTFQPSAPASDCCGAHEVCEYDEIKMDENRIEYYEDEELDAYKNISECDYTDSQIDEFREVLYTLQTHEIRYWLLSIERRKIQLPSILQEEARMLMVEG
ncbi:MAG: hypothetical protein ACERKD_12755 [Prolixibacteraceae bacterium]